MKDTGIFNDIPGSDSWAEIRFLEKGYSSDRKYFIRTKGGEKVLLRIADISRYEEKKKEYAIIQKFAAVGFPMSFPTAFGTCDENRSVYMILSWVEGEDLKKVLPGLSEERQYRLGRQAGDILKRIHGIPLDEEDRPRETKEEKKRLQLERYLSSSVRVPDDETAVQFVKDNLHKIWSEPPVYQHGDFHPGNLIYMPDGTIGVIDFNRWEAGDPYEEFYKLQSFGTEVSVPYAIGQIDAYFNDNIPRKFWEIQAVYVAHASLFSIKWAEKFGQAEIDGMIRRWEAASRDYDGFRQIVPRWYCRI